MRVANRAVREDIARNLIRHWQLADTLGISETTLVRWLRSPLTVERTTRIYNAIEEILDERKRGGHSE